jgi:hypothetical protein
VFFDFMVVLLVLDQGERRSYGRRLKLAAARPALLHHIAQGSTSKSEALRIQQYALLEREELSAAELHEILARDKRAQGTISCRPVS